MALQRWPRRLSLFLPLAVWPCIACGGGGGWQSPMMGDDPTAAVFQRRIAGREAYIDISLLPKPFKRVTDPVRGPAYLLFAEGRQLACLVTDVEFTMAVEGNQWFCSWRYAR